MFQPAITSPFRTSMVFVGLMLVASALRFPLLAQRPMHCDEAVNADKFGLLLEHGRYEYSTVDFHGPTLYYLTLLPSRIQGVMRYVDLNEITLRSVPAILGVLLVGLHFFLVPYFGLYAAAMSGLLTAVSPAMVYYSRYYIHEMLLVFLSFCTLLAVIRYYERRHAVWACSAGVCVGLMYATKETMIIPLGCMWAAAVALLASERKRGRAPIVGHKPVSGRHLAIALGAAILVAVLLMSTFFTHPRGVIDSVLAYRTYIERGSGINTFHVHPWPYYLNLLLFYHVKGGPVWSEALIAVLALLGLWATFCKAGVPGANPLVMRFVGIYALFMIGAYSLIPYKAPWNLLGFLHGMILLGGLGAAWLIHTARKRSFKVALTAVMCAGVAHLGWQAWESSIPFSSDPRNPWVYAHTRKDVYLIVRDLELLASSYPGGRSSLPVSIISRENLWPLPWYLRQFSSVQWWNGVSDTAPITPVVLITPDMEPALIRKLYDLPPPGQREMYVSMFDRYIELRPQVELRGYVVRSLWETP